MGLKNRLMISGKEKSEKFTVETLHRKGIHRNTQAYSKNTGGSPNEDFENKQKTLTS